MVAYYKLVHGEPEYRAQMLARADGKWIKRADYEADLAAARTEIARLTQRAGNAEAERDVIAAAAFEAAANYCWDKRDLLADAEKKQVEAGLTGRDYYGRRLEAELLSRAIRALTPADAKAALEAYGREKVREGMQRAISVTVGLMTANDARKSILAEMENLNVRT